MTEALAGNQEPTTEILDVIRNIAETGAKRTNTSSFGDRDVLATVLKELARHKNDLAGALCS
ncbi:ferredoxin-thioredoxin reductase/ catalytic subunit [Synechococcus sp. MIT S9220]|uniref:hypothetical protein n=1 Tax=unclassified Synechococcus TaxID=2626047 RepID=UPI00164A1F93|nr:hypothetical protein [Synechococcus sp. MIT S9220]NOL45996.1 hypothetical protein [Synechococcus sp. MIT S9220]QNJ23963.1 ferredoxin-thioredoxin reductase/ catalytic subunit [Synechococcus sp. MIT S9220]